MVNIDLELYKRLFIHRCDVFAAQMGTGAYIPVREPITDDDLSEHLAGIGSYGTYVIRPEDQTVKYVVFDLDTHDTGAFTDLCKLVHEMIVALGGMTLCCLAEFSGNKGTHVWLFLSEPVSAVQVRRWVARDFTPHWTALGHPMLEVFPKQDRVDEGGYGNLVKLPLGVHAVSGKRSTILGVRLDSFAFSLDEVRPLEAGNVPNIETPAPTSTDRTRARQASGDGPSAPFLCVDTILRQGVGKGMRDNGMFHLAAYLYGHGIDQDLAEELCLRANENFEPPLSEAEVRHKVTSAYRGRYATASCGSGWLRELCPGGPECKAGWNVRGAAKQGALRSADIGSVVEVEVVRVANQDRVRVLTVAHPDADNQPSLRCSDRSAR